MEISDFEYKMAMEEWTPAEKMTFEYLSTIVNLLSEISQKLEHPSNDLKFKSPLITVHGVQKSMPRGIASEGGSRMSP